MLRLNSTDKVQGLFANKCTCFALAAAYAPWVCIYPLVMCCGHDIFCTLATNLYSCHLQFSLGRQFILHFSDHAYQGIPLFCWFYTSNEAGYRLWKFMPQWTSSLGVTAIFVMLLLKKTWNSSSCVRRSRLQSMNSSSEINLFLPRCQKTFIVVFVLFFAEKDLKWLSLGTEKFVMKFKNVTYWRW